MNNIEKKLEEKGINKEDLEKRDIILSGTKDKKSQNARSCYEVMVHKLCNERCFFCSQDHKSRLIDVRPSDKEIYKRILFGYKAGYGMLGFTGGEPLIHPSIIKYIKFASKVGFKYIRIQTNGVMLGNPGFAKKCVEAGATLFKFSIHHYKPSIHDYLVGLPGALEKVEYGIRELKKLGCRIGINIVLTKQNYKDLPEFLLHYLNIGVTTFVIIFPLYENSMREEADKVGFKFTDAIYYVVKSLHIFDKLGLRRPLVLNLPMCLLPGYEDAIIQTFNGTAVLNLDGTKTNIDDNKAAGKKRVPICNDCKYNNICFGVDEEYLAYWGEDEFIKRSNKLDYNFSMDDLKINKYFTEDELCLIEILKYKNNLTVKEIAQLKDNFLICRHCNSMDKLGEVEKKLLEKGIIMVKGTGLNKVYTLINMKK